MSSRNKTIDILKFICALLVLFLHTVNIYRTQITGGVEALDYVIYKLLWFINPVEFFFVVSSFFLFSKKLEIRELYKIINRLIFLYLFWSLFYISNVINILNTDASLIFRIIKIFRLILLIGTGGHMWYVLSLIYSLLLLYPILLKNRVKAAWIISIFLYIINLFGDSYHNLIGTGSIVHKYYEILLAIMGGNLYLFRGAVFIMIGYTLATRKIKLSKEIAFFLFIVLGCLNNLELAILKTLAVGIQYSITITKPFVVFFFCYLAFECKSKIGKDTLVLAKCSTCIYFSHIFFREIVLRYIDNIHIAFVIILLLGILLTIIIDGLSKLQMLRFLKKVL